jgi:hypothetical protein
MTDVPFPLLTSPGFNASQAAGGRLLNCYPEKLAATAGKPYAYWRVPGLDVFGTVPSGIYRGGIQVSGTFYGLFGTTVYSWTSLGGAGTALTGAVPGTQDCAFAANMNTPPDIAIVSPGVGAFIITTGGTAIANYPGATVGSPNWVVYHLGFFIFTYGSGITFASDVNSTNINSLNFASAQSKPDTLFRPIPLGNGQLLLAGANTLEVWGGNVNATGYPFNYVSTIQRGIPGPMAIAGNEDGWGKGIFFVGDDNRVSTLTTYTPTPISVPDLDDLIEAEPDKTKINVGVYVAGGHGFVVVQGPAWCWEYDTTLQTWHERQSYLKAYWRGHRPIYTFSQWLCGDNDSPTLCRLSTATRKELGNPLAMRIETGPFGAFPQSVRINGIELYMTKGKSNALGHDPDETNAQIGISISRNGGNTWSKPRMVALGRQGISNIRARSAIWGQAEVQGVRWRFDESAGINFGFMGADMQSDTLR